MNTYFKMYTVPNKYNIANGKKEESVKQSAKRTY